MKQRQRIGHAASITDRARKKSTKKARSALYIKNGNPPKRVAVILHAVFSQSLAVGAALMAAALTGFRLTALLAGLLPALLLLAGLLATLLLLAGLLPALLRVLLILLRLLLFVRHVLCAPIMGKPHPIRQRPTRMSVPGSEPSATSNKL
jgi:hypothetical protein